MTQQLPPAWSFQETATIRQFLSWIQASLGEVNPDGVSVTISSGSIHDALCPTLQGEFEHEYFDEDPDVFSSGVCATLAFMERVTHIEDSIRRFQAGEDGPDDAISLQEQWGDNWTEVLRSVCIERAGVADAED